MSFEQGLAVFGRLMVITPLSHIQAYLEHLWTHIPERTVCFWLGQWDGRAARQLRADLLPDQCHSAVVGA